MNERERGTSMTQTWTRRGGWVLVALLVGSLLATFAFTGLVSAQPPLDPANPVRTLPAVVMPGDEFEVIVTFAAPLLIPPSSFNSIGLEDLAPAGWTVSVDVTWCDPDADFSNIPVPSTAQYVWWGIFPFLEYNPGDVFIARYKVQVPAGTAPGIYTFPDGTLEYYIGLAGPYLEDILGDPEIEVGAYDVGYSVYPVNKIRVLGPWIALGAVIMFGFGASLLVVIRHRSTQT